MPELSATSAASNAPQAKTYVEKVLEKWAMKIIATESVVVPHDAEEMNWRLFFAHSQDMMGFRGDIFTGGWNEADNPNYPDYRGLRDRWSDSKSMLAGLAALWEDEATKTKIVQLTTGKQTGDISIKPMMAVLRGAEANKATHAFADALDDLRGARIARRTRRMIRAYIQNSALLMQHDASFLNYLRSIAPDLVLPATDIVFAESAWRKTIMRDFYNVGPAIANYLIGDWLLWLWRAGQIEWFESYKSDSVFLNAMATAGKLPPEAVKDFLAYCRGKRLCDYVAGDLWVLQAGYRIPPRVLNEAIWLEEATTNQPQALVTTETAKADAENHVVEVDVEQTAWPIRFHHLWAENVEDEENSKSAGSDDLTATTPAISDKVHIFRDDDAGYLAWLRANRKGFIVNTNRQPNAKYLILHRPSCWCVSRPLNNEESWTAAYIKVCAGSVQDLQTWAHHAVSGKLHVCGICGK